MYRRKLLLAAACSFFFTFGHSQQFNTWYFGNAAGLTFNPGGATTPHALYGSSTLRLLILPTAFPITGISEMAALLRKKIRSTLIRIREILW